MHVDLDSLPSELTDLELARMKPAHRGILASRLELIWGACEPFIRDGVSTGSDARMVEVGLKCLVVLGRLYEVERADRQGTEGQSVVVAAASRRRVVLEGLEGRAGFLGGS